MSKQTALLAIAAAIIAGLAHLSWSQHGKIIALESSLFPPALNRASASVTRNKALSIGSAIPAANPGLDEVPAASGSDALRTEKFMKRQRLEQLGRFGEIFAALRLTPDQVSQFKELLLEKDRSRVDMIETAPNAGVDAFSKEWMRAKKVVDSPIEDRIRAVLGEDGYRDYQAVQEKRTLEASLRFLSETGCVGFFIDAGVPLSGSELNALAAVYRQLEQEGNMSSGDSVDPQTGLLPGHQAVLNHAKDVLSPDQLSALRQFYLSFFPWQ